MQDGSPPKGRLPALGMPGEPFPVSSNSLCCLRVSLPVLFPPSGVCARSLPSITPRWTPLERALEKPRGPSVPCARGMEFGMEGSALWNLLPREAQLGESLAARSSRPYSSCCGSNAENKINHRPGTEEPSQPSALRQRPHRSRSIPGMTPPGSSAEPAAPGAFPCCRAAELPAPAALHPSAGCSRARMARS